MNDERSIVDSKRLHLQRIFKQLGFNQKEIAGALALSGTSISRFLSTGGDRINLRPENIQRLIEVLQERLAECRAIKSVGNDELAARRAKGTKEEQTRAKAMISAALALNTETIRALESEIAELVTGAPALNNPARGPIVAMPGGALAVHAVNYIPRRADAEIDGILTEGRSVASIVTGPINGGASSFLNRVYQRAQEVPGCWARIVHLDSAFAEEEKFAQLDLFRFVFRRLDIPDDVLADNDVHEMKESFNDWARTAWKDATRVVLIIDGLDEIFKNASTIADPLALTNWLTALRNEASQGQPPFNRLALFVALTGKTWSAAHGSPYASQSNQLDLNKFTPAQVGYAFEQLGVAVDTIAVDEVHRLFHGHPYLTQLFAWSMRSGSSREEAREAALNFESRYETHWERLKSEIQFLTGDNFPMERVLATIAKATMGQRPPLDEDEGRIWRNYSRGLRIFGVIDGPSKTPTLCEFYRAAIERDIS